MWGEERVEKESQATTRRSSMMCQEMHRYVVTNRPSELISEISCFPPLVYLPPPHGPISFTAGCLQVQHGACGRVQQDEQLLFHYAILFLMKITNICPVSQQRTIPVAVRSKVWVCGRSLAGTAGSNTVGDIEALFLRVLCVVRYRSRLLDDHLSRGV